MVDRQIELRTDLHMKTLNLGLLVCHCLNIDNFDAIKGVILNLLSYLYA